MTNFRTALLGLAIVLGSWSHPIDPHHHEEYKTQTTSSRQEITR